MAARRRRRRDDVPVELRRLVGELRQCKDRCELSLTSLAAKTGFSVSSWQRYLGGRSLPPWEAVDALGRLGQAERGRLRVVWEAAAGVWADTDRPRTALGRGPSPEAGVGQEATGPAVEEATGPAGQEAAPHPTARSRVRRHAASVAAGACAVAAVLAWHHWGGDHVPVPQGAPAGAPAWPWPLRPTAPRSGTPCGPVGCQGLDPFREGCDQDAVTVHRLRALGRTLTLRWSPACHAGWAEVQPAEGTSGLLVAGDDGARQTAPAGAAWTAMIPGGPDATRAAVVVARYQLGVSESDSWADAVTGGTGPR
ncbi:helix-turn-helix domain-containing protein [Streptomyces sp. NPDC088253]|uniref:helix-turn-helix domain-containing protein n=1 Tax=Streptomyces sp. NPDC088253 TaxID=3365846 RepID=UPI0037F66639